MTDEKPFGDCLPAEVTHGGKNQPRDPRGMWFRGVESIERDAEALRRRSKGWSLQRISDDLGYGGKGNVSAAITRAKQDIIAEPARELIAQELAVLDHLIDRALEVLDREHMTISHGRVMRIGAPPEEGDTDERPFVLDDGPTLQAITTLQRLTESRRKLLGLDAAVRVDATVHEVTQDDLTITDLIQSAKARNALEREQIAGQS